MRYILTNERLVIFFVYILAYTCMTFIYLTDGVVYGDARGIILESYSLLILSYLEVILSVCIFLGFIAFLSNRIHIPQIINIKANYLHYLIFILNISFNLFSYRYNFGFSSVEVSQDIPKLLLYFFIIVQPVFLTYIYIAYFIECNKKIYFINIIFFVLSVIFKGWLGVILYVSILMFIKYKQKIIERFKVFLIFSCSFIILIPFIKMFKDILIAYHQFGFDSIISAAIKYIDDSGFSSVFELFKSYMIKTLGRMDHVSITYYVNINDFNSFQNIRSIYQEGWLNERISSALGYAPGEYIQKQLADYIFSAYKWQVQVPIPTRLILNLESLSMYFIYVFLMIFCSVILSKLISNQRAMQSLNYFTMFALLYHGWNYSLVLWLQTLIIFSLLLCLIRLMNKISLSSS